MIPDIVEPPGDLFDLILVDEAHHSPAKTWSELLKSFPQAKKILFTATPFRRDKREIEGSLVYNYFVSDFSAISHGQLYKVDEEFQAFDTNQIVTIDWKSVGVDITNECQVNNNQNGLSIHNYLTDYLPK